MSTPNRSYTLLLNIVRFLSNQFNPEANTALTEVHQLVDTLAEEHNEALLKKDTVIRQMAEVTLGIIEVSMATEQTLAATRFDLELQRTLRSTASAEYHEKITTMNTSLANADIPLLAQALKLKDNEQLMAENNKSVIFGVRVLRSLYPSFGLHIAKALCESLRPAPQAEPAAPATTEFSPLPACSNHQHVAEQADGCR